MLKYEQSELRRINTACQGGLSLRVERSSNNQLHGRNIGNWDKKRCTRCTGDSCFPLVDTWVCTRRCKNICGIHLGETQHKTNEGQNESVKCAPQSLDSVDCVHVCNEWSSFTRKTVSMFVALFYEWYRTAFSFQAWMSWKTSVRTQVITASSVVCRSTVEMFSCATTNKLDVRGCY